MRRTGCTRQDTGRRITLAVGLILAVGSGRSDGAPPGSGALPSPPPSATRNEFALDLFRATLPADGHEGCALAPAGVAATLAMALEGARGETAREIARVLGLDGPGASPDDLFPIDRPGRERPVDRPTLGAGLESNEGYGVKVRDVPDGSAAARAGLKPGDLILAVDDRPVRSRPRLDAALPPVGVSARLQVFEYESGRVVERPATPDRATEPAPSGGRDASSALRSARAAWVQSGTGIDPRFRASIRERFRAEVFPLDFRADPDAARRAVVAWFASRASTPGTVPVAEDIGPDTRFLLADSLAMRGTWTVPFPTSAPGPFRTEGGQTVTRLLMRRSGTLRVYRSDRFDALELPYAEGGLALLVVLPREAGPIDRFSRGLSAAEFQAAIEGLRPRTIDVILPTFRVGQTHRLARALAALGMARAFGDRADFSGIDPRQPLRLSDVSHAASVEVDERGTRAEASTAASGVLIKGDDPTPIPFHADRPFLFTVIDRRGAILLIGCVR